MNQFYVSIIFLGIMLIALSLVLIAYDRKRSYDYSKNMDAKKEELLGIINDAEQMVEELNKFSDYIVNQVDSKKEEINVSLASISEQIEQMNCRIKEKSGSKPVRGEKVANGSVIDIRTDNEMMIPDRKSDLVIENLDIKSSSPALTKTYKPQPKVKEKVIPIMSTKHREVLRLANEGLTETEIAKRMNLGRGEVQLILGMNR